MPKYIAAERAGALTNARVLEILSEKFSGAVDAQLNRDADDRIQPQSGSGDYAGLYLPDPDRYVEQASPTTQEAMGIQNVVFFSGQTTQTEYGPQNAHKSDGFLKKALVPWAVSFVFARKLGDQAISHPVLSRNLTKEEIVEARAQAYRDMIAYTLEKYGLLGTANTERAKAVKAVDIQNTFGSTYRIRTGDGDQDLRGVGFVEFQIGQWQQFPSHQQT